MPLFSVVIPLFNKQPFIRRCIESILRQTVQDFEINVVDDGSTDGSSDVVRSIQDPRVNLIVQANRGVGAARNTGIAAARGRLIAFLDADDEWRPFFLEAMRTLHQSYPQAGLLATGYRRCLSLDYRFDRELTLVSPPARPQFLLNNFLRVAIFSNFVTSSSTAVARSVIDTLGGFDEDAAFGEDLEFWLRIALRYPTAFDARILAICHSEAANRACNRRPKKAQYPPAIRTLRAALEQRIVSDEMVRDAFTYIDLWRMQYVYWHLQFRDVEGARYLLKEQFLRVRFRIEAFLLRIGIRSLPVRLILALKYKPTNLWSWLRQPIIGQRILGSGERRLGRQVLVRIVPQHPV